MRIDRIINNNVVLAHQGRERYVLMGRGLGFGARRGDAVDDGLVEQTFVLEEGHSAHLPEQIAGLPLEHVRAATVAAKLAGQLLDARFTQTNLISLADHVSFAVRRVQQQIEVDYPLQWEVTQLYPRELETARAMVRAIEAELGIELPAGEPSALALHLVNSQFGGAKVSQTLAMTQTIGRVIRLVQDAHDIQLEDESLTLARFVTHLRYLFVRARDEGRGNATVPELRTALIAAYRPWLGIAAQIRAVIEQDTGLELTADEELYLALHTARLVTAARG